MYVNPNFKTKKALKDALKNNEFVQVFPPGLGTVPRNGIVHIEGPHSPKPHTWGGEGMMKDGKLVRIK